MSLKSGVVNWDRCLLLSPTTILLILAFVFPLVYIIPEAFGGDAVKRFLRIFQSPVYTKIIWTTVLISLEVTVITLVVSFPLAWILSRATGVKALLLGLLVLIPFLTSVLVRTFAWLAILGQRGLVNSILLWLGIISEPIPLLFTETAVVLALVHSAIPMMVFALYTVLRRVDGRILLAAHTLGANPARAWLGMVVPLAIKGIQSGVVIVFLFTMASFIAPAFLGNQRQQMLAQVIQNEIETGANWAFAAALGLTLALIATVIVIALSMFTRLFSRWQSPESLISKSTEAKTVTVDRELLRNPVRRAKSFFDFDASFLWKVGVRLTEPVYLIIISIYLLLPLVILFPVSFSSAEVLVFPPPGYSLRWFEEILSNSEWVDAAWTSFRIAVATCVLTLILGTLTVLGFGRNFRYQGTAEAIVLSPMTVPSVVFALGAYLSFSKFGLVDTELGITLAHTVLVLPIVYLVTSATFSSIDPGLTRAAASLGASPFRAFKTITFPLLLPGLSVGALLAVLQSFDESIASIFLSNLSVKTLPRKLWEGIRFNTSPESAAVSAMLLTVTCIIILVGIVIILRRARKLSLTKQGQAGET